MTVIMKRIIPLFNQRQNVFFREKCHRSHYYVDIRYRGGYSPQSHSIESKANQRSTRVRCWVEE